MEHIKNIRWEEREYITSYDGKAPFTSDPVDPAFTIIKSKLEQAQDPHKRTPMSIHHILTLLELCLKNTYFLLQGKYYEQVHETAMGAQIGPIAAHLFMDESETKALNNATDFPRL